MRLGLNLGYWGSAPIDNVALAQEADRLGLSFGVDGGSLRL